jgi:glycerol-3-phosphate acyltransferase PlsX
VVKSHGSADELSFANAIREAMLEVQKAVLERIGKQLELISEQRRAV